MAKITSILAREILDSRGIPTVEARVALDTGISAIASVPSGPELGDYQAVELRDHDESRFKGFGVLTAVAAVNTIIAPSLLGKDPEQQGLLDKVMIDLDGTHNKSKLGANSMLAVSYAICRAAAAHRRVPLYAYINQLIHIALPNTTARVPVPIFNMINGGKHGAGNLDFQEYHMIPSTLKTYDESLRMGVDIYHSIRQTLISRNATYSIGEEGGFAPNLYTNIDAIEALAQSVRTTPYHIGNDVFLGLDVAAAHFKRDDGYVIKDRPVALKSHEFIDYLTDLNRDYHLLLLEDPLGSEDWDDWATITAELRQSLVIVGDDLLASNPARLKTAITKHACSAILVKPNQIGTLSETLQLIQMARIGGFKVILSHRSGETNDDFVADLAVAVAAEYVKFGAPVRGERVAKYNRLSEIYTLLTKK